MCSLQVTKSNANVTRARLDEKTKSPSNTETVGIKTRLQGQIPWVATPWNLIQGLKAQGPSIMNHLPAMTRSSNNANVTRARFDKRPESSNNANVTRARFDEKPESSNNANITRARIDKEPESSNNSDVTRARFDEKPEYYSNAFLLS